MSVKRRYWEFRKVPGQHTFLDVSQNFVCQQVSWDSRGKHESLGWKTETQLNGGLLFKNHCSWTSCQDAGDVCPTVSCCSRGVWCFGLLLFSMLLRFQSIIPIWYIFQANQGPGQNFQVLNLILWATGQRLRYQISRQGSGALFFLHIRLRTLCTRADC